MDHYDDDYSGRSRWLRFGALGLSSIVLAVAAFGIGRLSAPLNGGQRVVVSPQNGPGPTRVENGVPVGYAHTQDGAVAAATNFIMVFDGPLTAQPGKYRAAIDTLAAPDAKDKLQRDGLSQQNAFQSVLGLVSNAEQGRSVVFRTVPLTYHVDTYDGTRAQVSIWSETLVAVDGSYAPRVSWTTGHYTVAWVADDWRLAAVGNYTGASDGPVPITGQTPVQTANLPTQLKDFKDYRHDVSP